MASHHKIDEIRRNLKKLLDLNPSGIPVNNLATNYNTQFQQKLKLCVNGINGIRGLPDVFDFIEIVDETGMEMLRLRKGEEEDKFKSTTKESENACGKIGATNGNTIKEDSLTSEEKSPNVSEEGNTVPDVEEKSELQNKQQLPLFSQQTGTTFAYPHAPPLLPPGPPGFYQPGITLTYPRTSPHPQGPRQPPGTQQSGATLTYPQASPLPPQGPYQRMGFQQSMHPQFSTLCPQSYHQWRGVQQHLGPAMYGQPSTAPQGYPPGRGFQQSGPPNETEMLRLRKGEKEDELKSTTTESENACGEIVATFCGNTVNGDSLTLEAKSPDFSEEGREGKTVSDFEAKSDLQNNQQMPLFSQQSGPPNETEMLRLRKGEEEDEFKSTTKESENACGKIVATIGNTIKEVKKDSLTLEEKSPDVSEEGKEGNTGPDVEEISDLQNNKQMPLFSQQSGTALTYPHAPPLLPPGFHQQSGAQQGTALSYTRASPLLHYPQGPHQTRGTQQSGATLTYPQASPLPPQGPYQRMGFQQSMHPQFSTLYPQSYHQWRGVQQHLGPAMYGQPSTAPQGYPPWRGFQQSGPPNETEMLRLRKGEKEDEFKSTTKESENACGKIVSTNGNTIKEDSLTLEAKSPDFSEEGREGKTVSDFEAKSDLQNNQQMPLFSQQSGPPNETEMLRLRKGEEEDEFKSTTKESENACGKIVATIGNTIKEVKKDSLTLEEKSPDVSEEGKEGNTGPDVEEISDLQNNKQMPLFSQQSGTALTYPHAPPLLPPGFHQQSGAQQGTALSYTRASPLLHYPQGPHQTRGTQQSGATLTYPQASPLPPQGPYQRMGFQQSMHPQFSTLYPQSYHQLRGVQQHLGPAMYGQPSTAPQGYPPWRGFQQSGPPNETEMLRLRKGEKEDEFKSTTKESENACGKIVSTNGNTIKEDSLTFEAKSPDVSEEVREGKTVSDVEGKSDLQNNQQMPLFSQQSGPPNETEMLRLRKGEEEDEFKSTTKESENACGKIVATIGNTIKEVKKDSLTLEEKSPDISEEGKEGNTGSDVDEFSDLQNNKQMPLFSQQSGTALTYPHAPPLFPPGFHQQSGAQQGTALPYPRASPLLPFPQGPRQTPGTLQSGAPLTYPRASPLPPQGPYQRMGFQQSMHPQFSTLYPQNYHQWRGVQQHLGPAMYGQPSTAPPQVYPPWRGFQQSGLPNETEMLRLRKGEKEDEFKSTTKESENACGKIVATNGNTVNGDSLTLEEKSPDFSEEDKEGNTGPDVEEKSDLQNNQQMPLISQQSGPPNETEMLRLRKGKEGDEFMSTTKESENACGKIVATNGNTIKEDSLTLEEKSPDVSEEVRECNTLPDVEEKSDLQNNKQMPLFSQQLGTALACPNAPPLLPPGFHQQSGAQQGAALPYPRASPLLPVPQGPRQPTGTQQSGTILTYPQASPLPPQGPYQGQGVGFQQSMHPQFSTLYPQGHHQWRGAQQQSGTAIYPQPSTAVPQGYPHWRGFQQSGPPPMYSHGPPQVHQRYQQSGRAMMYSQVPQMHPLGTQHNFPLMPHTNEVNQMKQSVKPVLPTSESKTPSTDTGNKIFSWNETTAVDSSIAGDSDWPALNSTKKTKKQTKRDLKAEAENRRIKFEHLDNSDIQYRNDGKIPTKDDINSRALFHIQALAEQNEHVSVDLVMKGVMEHFGKTNIQQLGLRKATDLEAIYKHQRLLCRINAYIYAFCHCRSIATLFELHKDLEKIEDGKDSFEELNVGPLSKFPAVYTLFKFPPYKSDDDIMKVTTLEILELLKNYMDKNYLWRSKVELKGFMEFIMEHYGISDPYQLGIRVQSVALGVCVVRRAIREEKNMIGECSLAIMVKLKQEAEASLASVKKSILEPANTDRERSLLDNRRRYADMTAAEAILKVFENAQPLLSEESSLRSFFRSLPAIVNNSIARNLFQLAICLGNMEFPQEYLPAGTEEEKLEKENEAEESVCANKIPDHEEIVSDVETFLNRLKDVPTLIDLAKIESSLCRKRHLSNFMDLRKGTFLEFITRTPKLLQQFGGSILGATNQKHNQGTPYHPSINDLIEFIRQCGKQNMNDNVVEMALCEHFQTTSVDSFGRGSLQRLISKAKITQHGEEQNCITYEQALCTQTRIKQVSGSHVGVRGHQSRCNALLSLNSAPLLEDLSEWSQWTLIFKPEHGELKGFIEKWSGAEVPYEQEDTQLDEPIKIFALETQPGVLLKLASKTSPDDFKTSAIEEDARLTTGHLVSILTRDGIQNAPLVLLQNYFESALKAIFSKDVPLVPGGPPEKTDADTKVASFVLDCMCLIPTKICHAVAEVFLKPLSEVIGDKRSKKLLKDSCFTTKQLNKLQQLGFLLGIVEWSETFTLKLEYSSSIEEDRQEDIIDIASLRPETDKPESDTSFMSQEEEDNLHFDTDEDIDFELKTSFDASTENDEYSPAEDILEDLQGDESEINDEVQSEVRTHESKPAEMDEIEENDTCCDIVEPNPEEMQSSIKDQKAPPTKLTQCQEEMQHCKAVVDNIRNKEFGIGAILSEEGESLMTVQKGRIARSLERLSSELYSKDTHFVLELVQNADDNTYNDDCKQPSLLFQLEDGHITVYNNEKGFSAENIHALCDVGKSTKGKHKYGYIGHKGIGFKSVFRVTDRPEIHSNGFHICFDRQADSLGYILPTWIGASNVEDVTEDGDKDSKGWQTRIVLPLKDEVSKTNKLLNRFDDIQPSLLLFLHRLRSIQVVNQPKSTVVEMKRTDHLKNVIEIKHSDGTDFWLVVKEMINVNKTVCDRANMESTELALAFPLPKGKSASEFVLKDQYIFAYLPLRSYGFKFIIQGDFDIPSSREDVDSDSAWNQYIKQHLPSLFIKALQFFKDYYGSDNEEVAVCKFLQFVPVEGQILGFFQSVAKDIHQKLKSCPCLPVQVPDENGSKMWTQPSEAIIVHDRLVQELVPPEVLHCHLGCYYLSNVVSSMLNVALLRSLGVKVITTRNLISLFKGEVLKAKADGVNLNITNIAKWLTCIYRCREEEHDISEEPIKEIQALPIIPLSNGKWTDLQDKSVFFSLTFEKQRTDVKKAAKKEMQGSIQNLESDMYILHGDFMTCQNSLANSQVMLMMEQLGVCHIEPRDVIHNHILPALRSEDWKEKPAEVLVSYIVYIKDQMQLQSDICKMSDIKSVAQIRTDKGTFANPSREPIHFTKTYGNKYDLKNDLTGVEWIFVDECYLRCSQQHSALHISQWQRFLTELGVLNLIAIERKTLTLQKTDLASSIWGSEYDAWPVPSDGCYQVEDSRSKELEKLFENNTKGTDDNHRVMMNFLYILQNEWDYFDKFVDASLVIDSQRKKSIESSFAKLLLRSSWISTTPTLNPEGGDFTGKRLLPPNQVFLASRYLYDFLDKHVPYLSGPTPRKNELIRFLGIKGEDVVKNISFLFDMLRGWCTRGKKCQPDGIMKSGATFTTSVKHILQVYNHLQRYAPPEQLQQFFDTFPAVFLPSIQCEEHRVVTGRFVHKSLTYWIDPTKLLHKYGASSNRDSVIEIYKPTDDFFQRQLKIDDTPTMLEYLQLLVKITSENQLPNVNVLADILKIFGILGEKCAISGHTYSRSRSAKKVAINVDTKRADYLKNNLKEYKVFPTKANRWVALDDDPMIVDEGSKELEKLFSSNQDIHFLQWDVSKNPNERHTLKIKPSFEETNEYENVQCFLQACGVKYLSECIEHEPIEEHIRPCPRLKNLMHRVVPYLQSFLFSKFVEVYERLVSKVKIISKLKIMNFMTASRLEVIYRINYTKDGEIITTTSSTERKCTITRNFYIHKAIEQNFQEDSSVRKEIAKLFSDGDNACQKEMNAFLMLVMKRSNQAFDDEEFLNEFGLSRVEGVELWEVEKAEEPTPVPAPKPVVVLPTVNENGKTTKHGLEKAEEGSGIYSWPPKSSAYELVKTDKTRNPSGKACLEQWPLPQPHQPLANVPSLRQPPTHHVSAEKLETDHSDKASAEQWPLPQPAQPLANVPSPRQAPKQHVSGKKLATPDSKMANKLPKSDLTNDRQVNLDHQTTATVVSDVDRKYVTNSLPEMRQSKSTDVNQSFTKETSTQASGVDRQFQTPPNPQRIVSLSSSPRSGSSTRTFSPSPSSEVQLIEEDITPNLRDLPFFEDTQRSVSNPSDDIIGRWGEELVYHLLKNQYEGKSDVRSTVRWKNEQNETGYPYDIEIQTHIEGGVHNEYIEVKATNTSEKKYFQISANEVTFAQLNAPNYHLYRVYNAGKKDDVRVCSLKNLSEKMVKKEVVLFMKI